MSHAYKTTETEATLDRLFLAAQKEEALKQQTGLSGPAVKALLEAIRKGGAF